MEENRRIIVTLSGGKASAWCAGWAFKNFKKEDIILYFNDTKWEHPDLYRFLNDLEKHFNHKIIWDSDGRNPAQVFLDNNFLGNNRVPICSRILKAERLQNYFQEGDILIFGIGIKEKHRAIRLVEIYSKIMAKRRINAFLKFPLIEKIITEETINQYLLDINIKQPKLYELGFSHNNCSGGCVRAGKKQWLLLLDKLPDVYKQREDFEEAFSNYIGKDVTFMNGISLKKLRENNDLNIIDGNVESLESSECIGICDLDN